MEIEAVMIDWDYQLLSLLKRTEVLSDNRMAGKHIQSLKKRFERERKFSDSYKIFIDELLVKEMQVNGHVHHLMLSFMVALSTKEL